MHNIIKWFARNEVASNLIMWLTLLLGIYFVWQRIPVEYFPDNNPDEVSISMTYRGATPEEVEEGIVIKIENAIRDLPGIRELRSISSEGRGEVEVEVERGMDPRAMLDDIKNRIDAINTFAQNTERPITVTMGTNTIVGTDTEKIIAAAGSALNETSKKAVSIPLWDGHTAERIVAELGSNERD